MGPHGMDLGDSTNLVFSLYEIDIEACGAHGPMFLPPPPKKKKPARHLRFR